VPTKKQRRRRAKDRRHEYEYVYVDGEGREVDAVDAPDAPMAPPKRERARGAGRAASGRAIQPPSWRRVGKRALIFAPLMFLTVTLLARDQSVPASVAQTLFLLLIFVPFSYVMDSVTYRIWRRRTGQTESGATGRR
jgi:hypothetical protein